MAERLFDNNKALQFLDSGYTWHVIESGRAEEIWVDDASQINSLIVIEAVKRPYCETDTDVHIEAHSEESLKDLLSILKPSKRYFAIFQKDWICKTFEKEFNVNTEYISRQYHYRLKDENFSPCKLYPVIELSANDSALVDTLPEEDWRERSQRHLGFNTKAFGIAENDQLISCAFTWDSGKEREIDWIYTRPDKRKRGYGATVASVAAEYIFQSEGEAVMATADWDNTGSIRIWEKLGFDHSRTTYFCAFLKP